MTISEEVKKRLFELDDGKNRRIVRSPEEVYAFIKKARAIKSKIYLDTETMGIRERGVDGQKPYHGSKVVGLAAHIRASGWFETIYIPLRHAWQPVAVKDLRPAKKHQAVSAAQAMLLDMDVAPTPMPTISIPTGDESFANADLKAMIAPIQALLSCDLPKVWWHEKSDRQMLAEDEDGHWKMSKPIEDLLLVCQVIYAGRHMSFNLKRFSQAQFNLDTSAYDRIDAWMKKNKMKWEYGMAEAHAWLTAEYCMADSELLGDVDERIPAKDRQQAAQIIELEHNVSFELSEMERNGCVVNVPYLEQQIQKMKAEMEEIQGRYESPLSENPEMVEYLLLQKVVLTKLAPRWEKLPPDQRPKELASKDYALDEEVLEALDHPAAKDILRWRSAKKAWDFLVELQWNATNSRDGRVHASFIAMVRTGRASCADPNLHQMPTKAEAGVRMAFIPPEGYDLWLLDYDQLQLRLAAIISHDANMVRAFEEGRDIHEETRQFIKSETRRLAKNVNFALIFGAGAERLAKTAGIPLEQATLFLQRLREEAYPDVRKCYYNLRNKANENDGVIGIPSGRRRFLIPEKRHDAFNSVIQMLEADFTKKKLCYVAAKARKLGGWVSCWVHDEFHIVLPKTTPMKKIMQLAYNAENHQGRVQLTATLAKAIPSWGKKEEIKRERKVKVAKKDETAAAVYEPEIPPETPFQPKHFIQEGIALGGVAVRDGFPDWTMKRLERENAVCLTTRKDGSILALAGSQQATVKAPLGSLIVSTDELALAVWRGMNQQPPTVGEIDDVKRAPLTQFFRIPGIKDPTYLRELVDGAILAHDEAVTA